MKVIIKFYILATIGVLLLTASCSSDDSDPSNGGVTGGGCIKIEYTGSTKYPFYRETSRFATEEPSTNGQIVWRSQGLNGYGYKVECF